MNVTRRNFITAICGISILPFVNFFAKQKSNNKLISTYRKCYKNMIITFKDGCDIYNTNFYNCEFIGHPSKAINCGVYNCYRKDDGPVLSGNLINTIVS